MYINNKKMANIILLFVIVMLCNSSISFGGSNTRRGTAGAQELLIPVGSRNIAMSGSFVAGINGIEAAAWNPAGVSGMEGNVDVIFFQTSWLAGIGVNYAAFASNFGGKSYYGLESTVIYAINKNVKILRLGSVTQEQISKIIPNIIIENSDTASKLSPGQQKKHYSPNLPLRINVNEVYKNEALLNFGSNHLKSDTIELNLSYDGNLEEAAKNFYDYIHRLDNTKCLGIAVAPIPNNNLGKTINDRLIRASTND